MRRKILVVGKSFGGDREDLGGREVGMEAKRCWREPTVFFFFFGE